MTQKHQNAPALAGVFEAIMQRVKAAPESEPGRVLAAFAASLLNGEEFNLAQIEQLPSQDDQGLCLSLFNYCISVGLAEDERREASEAFAPYIEIHQSGTRH